MEITLFVRMNLHGKANYIQNIINMFDILQVNLTVINLGLID